MELFAWNRYTKKMHEMLLRPLSIGNFSQVPEGMFCGTAMAGSKEEGNWFELEILVDLSDGIIADVKYRFFGPTILLILLEATARYLIRKNVLQAGKLNLKLLDRFLAEDGSNGIEEKHTPYAMFVLDATYSAVQQVPATAIGEFSTPLEGMSFSNPTDSHADWMNLNEAQRLHLLETTFEEHIRPLLAIDEGGVQILRVEDDIKVVIAYSGSCTTCYSAIGGTLQGIQTMLQQKVYPSLTVVPDMENLKFF